MEYFVYGFTGILFGYIIIQFGVLLVKSIKEKKNG